jgi:hypothetical protein
MIVIVTVRYCSALRYDPDSKEKTRRALPFAAGFSCWSPTYVITGATESKFLEARPRSPLRLRASIAPATTRATDLVKSNER